MSVVPMRVYLDACCLNRPFDDQLQDRIRLESEAVLLIISHLEAGNWTWIKSDVLDLELEQMPDRERFRRVRALASCAHRQAILGEVESRRAQELEQLGFGAYDAMHLACAESERADVLLATDDGLRRLAQRHADHLGVRVENPLVWIGEVTRE